MATAKLTSYLRTCRKKSGLTLQDSAYLLGISYSDLSRYETYRKEVPLGVALSCCLLYGFTLQQVFAGVYDLCVALLSRRLTLYRNRLAQRIAKSESSAALTQKLSWVSMRLAQLSVVTI